MSKILCVIWILVACLWLFIGITFTPPYKEWELERQERLNYERYLEQKKIIKVQMDRMDFYYKNCEPAPIFNGTWSMTMDRMMEIMADCKPKQK